MDDNTAVIRLYGQEYRGRNTSCMRKRMVSTQEVGFYITKEGRGMSVRSKHMMRDGKDLPLSGNSVIVQFVISVVVLLPILLALIPLVIVFQTIILIKGKIFPIKKRATETEGHSGNEEHKSESKSKKRDFDLVLYGATGFTGRLAALYIAKKYGSKSFRWVRCILSI